MDFAPPTTGLYPGQEEKPDEPAPVVDDGRPLTAQQRLAALKAKLSDSRKTNHKAVVEEDLEVAEIAESSTSRSGASTGPSPTRSSSSVVLSATGSSCLTAKIVLLALPLVRHGSGQFGHLRSPHPATPQPGG